MPVGMEEVFLPDLYCKKKAEYRNGEPTSSDALAPPMAVSAIEAFEQRYGVRIPDDLRGYLTCVSQEVFASKRPVHVRLEFDDPEWYEISDGPEDAGKGGVGVCRIDGDACERDFRGLLMIGDDGDDGLFLHIVIDPTSPWHGCVFEESTDGYLYRRFDSFTDYLAKDVRQLLDRPAKRAGRAVEEVRQVHLPDLYNKKMADYAKAKGEAACVGDKLWDPLDAAEIEAFEQRYGVRIPDDLRSYLTCVSQVVFASMEPVAVLLKFDHDEGDSDYPDDGKGGVGVCRLDGYEVLPENIVHGGGDYRGLMHIGSPDYHIVVDPTSSWYGCVFQEDHVDGYFVKYNDSFTEYLARDVRRLLGLGIETSDSG